jgi:hypothetical protein
MEELKSQILDLVDKCDDISILRLILALLARLVQD